MSNSLPFVELQGRWGVLGEPNPGQGTAVGLGRAPTCETVQSIKGAGAKGSRLSSTRGTAQGKADSADRGAIY